MSEQQNEFNGWAIVELFGHQKIAGQVTTEYYGTACMFRVDVPELPEREVTLRSGEYSGHTYLPAGTRVRRPLEPGYSRLLGVSAIYALNPASKETVLRYVDAARKLPLIPLDLERATALIASADGAAGEEDEEEDEEEKEWSTHVPE